MFYFRSDQKSSAFKLIRFAKVNYIVSWRWKYQNHFALVLSGQRLYVKWRFPWAMRWQSPPTDFNPSLAELGRAGQSLAELKYQIPKYQIPDTSQHKTPSHWNLHHPTRNQRAIIEKVRGLLCLTKWRGDGSQQNWKAMKILWWIVTLMFNLGLGSLAAGILLSR